MTLPDNEIHLYLARADQISDPDLLAQYENLLSHEERTRLPRFYHQRHRHQFLITRALQRSCLSRFSAVKPADWRFKQNGYGKPGILQPSDPATDRQPLQFNLSHTAGLIICGITTQAAIGVDVEDQQRSTQAAFSSLFSYFSRQEIAQLEKLPAEQQKVRFFQHWTLKEAYIKARGAGFAIALNQFGFGFKDGSLETFFIHESEDDDAANWQFWQGRVDDRYPIAIALDSSQKGMNVIVHECVPLLNDTACTPINLQRFSNR